MYKNRNQLPKRAESLQLYKLPKTIQLPRFHSKPKNIISPHPQPSKKLDTESSKNSKHLDRKKVMSVANRLKFRKKEDGPHCPVTEKKVNNVEECDIAQRIKINFKSIPMGGNAEHKQEVTSHDKQKKNFRSKSLKNAVKHRQGVMIMTENNTPQKKQKTRNLLTEQPSMQGVNILHKVKKRQPDLSTQPTQVHHSENEKQLWGKIIDIFKYIILEEGNLDWAQEYIVMEKYSSEKKLYHSFPSNEPFKIKQKIKKHICISRIVIYLYASLILNRMEVKNMMGIFGRLKESFQIIFMIAFKKQLSKDRIVSLNKNNELNVKTLLMILSKKKIPHHALLKNMLESSLKIQSFQFIEVVDKTLKWELLRMPSFPFLPSTQHEKHLVLDLDETLVHFNNQTQTFHVRPFAEQFLKKVSQIFQITIFTAATQEYADEILNQIDAEQCISYKLYRNHLTYIQNVPVKDLSMLGRPMNKIMIVDNISNNFRLQPDNGIQIHSWYEDDDDEVLGKLYALLIKIIAEHPEDYRQGIKKYKDFILDEIAKHELIYELKQQL